MITAAHIQDLHKAAHLMLQEASAPDLIVKVDPLVAKLDALFDENELSVITAAIGHVLGTTLDDDTALQVVLGTINVAAFAAHNLQYPDPAQVKQ